MGRDHLDDDTTVDRTSSLRHRLALQLGPWMVVVAAWVALWGEVSLGNLAGGIAVATLITVLFHPGRRERLGRLRPLAAARFVGFVASNLVRSTAAVAWEVLTPTDRTRPGIIGIHLPSATPVVLSAVTTAIGLTPGTVVVDVGRRPTIVYVHVLHLRDPADVRAEMRRLESLALAAFGPDDAGDDIAALTSRSPANPGRERR